MERTRCERPLKYSPLGLFVGGQGVVTEPIAECRARRDCCKWKGEGGQAQLFLKECVWFASLPRYRSLGQAARLLPSNLDIVGLRSADLTGRAYQVTVDTVVVCFTSPVSEDHTGVQIAMFLPPKSCF